MECLAGSRDVYKLFDPATPDGSYDFTPPGDGIGFDFIGALVGTCDSRFKNPATTPVFDCARLKQWTP